MLWMDVDNKHFSLNFKLDKPDPNVKVNLLKKSGLCSPEINIVAYL
jgi:hypothetical protein